jgi:uncharacterized membrane protein (DUF373 family)
MIKPPFRNWAELRDAWNSLPAYERFELLVGMVLRGVIGAIIAVALYRLIVRVIDTLVLRALDPLEHAVFQQVFGSIMTLLIALEFSHTLRYVLPHERGIIQARIVILIALLALTRKIIVAEPFDAAPASVAGLAALTLSLGVTYWLVRDREDRARAGHNDEADRPS